MSQATTTTAPSQRKEVAAPSTAVVHAERDIVVLDTSVLLADPESIFNIAGADIVLPLKVIEELDNHKDRLDEVGRAARTVAHSLEELRVRSDEHDLRNPVALPADSTLRVVINGQQLDKVEHLGLEIDKADNRILAAALGLRVGPQCVKVVSADVNLRLKAAALGLAAEEYVQTRPGFHSAANPGWRDVGVSAELIERLYADKCVALDAVLAGDLDALRSLGANEFGVLKAGQQSALARRVSNELRLVRRDISAWDLRPRNKEQRFALDLLLDQDVPIVALSGRAGTGKTMLAIAAGLEQVFEPASQRYERLMIIRPMYAVERQDIGFLPGDLDEKLEPWFATVEDTIAALSEDKDRRKARDLLEMWAEAGKIDMQPLTFLRGRSLQHTFVLVDEAQSMEPLTLKTILTRLGEGSKVVFTGDISQIDSPFVSERTSALAVLADRFAGQSLFGQLVLTHGERSAVADLASELL